MNKEVKEWWEANKWDMFWYKYRLIMGLDPKGNATWLQEKRHFAQVERIRKQYDEIDNPHRIFEIAHFLDLQPLLEKWWDKLDRQEKEKYLTQTWFNKMDGFLLGLDWWIPFFNELGFITNCNEPKPTEPVTLYRGVEPFFLQGMSWTPKLEMAVSFSESVSLLKGGKRVYKTTVNPESVLAVFKGNGVTPDGEKFLEGGLEYVINHRELGEIEEVEGVKS